MHVFYAKPDDQEPYVLLRKQEEIAIYQLLPTSGFSRHSHFKSRENLRWTTLTNRNYLTMYFASECFDEDQTVRPHIEILEPRYQQGIMVGNEIRIHEREESDTNSTNSGTQHEKSTEVEIN